MSQLVRLRMRHRRWYDHVHDSTDHPQQHRRPRVDGKGSVRHQHDEVSQRHVRAGRGSLAEAQVSVESQREEEPDDDGERETDPAKHGLWDDVAEDGEDEDKTCSHGTYSQMTYAQGIGIRLKQKSPRNINRTIKFITYIATTTNDSKLDLKLYT